MEMPDVVGGSLNIYFDSPPNPQLSVSFQSQIEQKVKMAKALFGHRGVRAIPQVLCRKSLDPLTTAGTHM